VSKLDGGPAFPQITELGDIASTNNGMTLRDYFAAKAMQALIPDEFFSNSGGKGLEKVCILAYRFSDTMLKQRESQNQSTQREYNPDLEP